MDLLITYFVLSSRSLWYPRATIILSLNHSRWLVVVPLDDFRSSLRNPAHCKRSEIGFVLYASALSAGGMENEFFKECGT